MREKVLMCNWRRDIDDMILMLDNEVKQGSELHILSHLSLEERQAIFELEGFDESKLANLKLVQHVGRSSVRRDLQALPLHFMDSVMIRVGKG